MCAVVLIDNDALVKLARYGQLDQALLALGHTSAQVRVLQTATYTLLPSKQPLRHCKDQASADRLAAFLDQVEKIDASTADAALLDALVTVPGIDAGEAVLFACAATQPGTLVLTGDKRAVQALHDSPVAAPAVAALENRVICMEALFRGLVMQDFASTQSCVRSNLDVDKALTAIFGVAVPASAESVQQGLNSYEGSLRAKTGTLLRAA
jgi:hypothetical protein